MDILTGLPEATIIRDLDAMEPFLRDESHLRGVRPLAVTRPHGPGALRELVRRAKTEGFGLVPRGAGTGKAGGCVPTERTVVVDLSEWPGEIRVCAQDLCLSAPASAPLRAVKAAAEAQGLFYPPDPNSWESCALGGTLATNAGGPNACKYGMTRHWVLAVEALLEDGELHTFGINSVKANTGPSFGQLLIGSEGIFGFILGATLRLLPLPREHVTLLLPVKRWEDLLDLPGRLAEAGYLASAFEFFDPAVLAELRAHGPEAARRLPGEAVAILEFDERGCAAEPFLQGLLDLLGPIAQNLELASDERQRQGIWAVRRLTSAFLKERHPAKVSEDIVVPRSRLRDFFAGLSRLGLPAVTYGHLGDGNLHVNLLTAGDMQPALLERQLMDLFRLTLSLGGTLSGEHGIGLTKRDAFLALTDPAQLRALRAIKGALDPQGIFNPGKVL